jgi:hypothetical protein
LKTIIKIKVSSIGKKAKIACMITSI